MEDVTDTYNAKLIELHLDSQFFNREAILKCLYWYTIRYLVDVFTVNQNQYRLSLRPLSNDKGISDPQATYEKLKKDLFDFQLRQVISQETHHIRELLIAKAFANGALDEEPTGSISDPVGFNPE